ncbi:acyltransferase family protein [Curtobacterium pusillum]|uniref:Acyltransferase n=1 Tax=Curtobacterium pusillum TaxID=69373 RepID=A0ABX2M8C6_9MICO|nr:acyltransferase family protein [Curtobacterium pusillum]NUU13869.1 acyltransferase [Curtobacterium pusillum]GLK30457.1 acyltransferase [Curtobacterium pusillum]
MSGRHAVQVRPSGPRADIQLLRAFAVLAVITYHFWPARLHGGFVGVDVFFVISGYLICGQLFGELDRSGTIAVTAFWARRAKRLLPAAITVIAVTGIATVLVLPRPVWQDTFRQLAASAVYLQNWLLASDSVDYLAAENAPTAVQHFWSLSVEEQFYIAVPVLLIAVALVFRRRSRPAVVRAATVVIVAIVIVSFVYSVVATANTPGPAYFSTGTRAWEFGVGAVAAAVPAAWFENRLTRTAVTVAGAAGLVVSLVAITPSSAFPGAIAAIPVAATALLLAARPLPSPSTGAPVVVRFGAAIGDRSYSLYLWHWPALVFARTVSGEDLGWPVKLLVLVVVVGLAEASLRWIETPFRRRRITGGRRSMILVASALALTLVVATPMQTVATTIQRASAAELQRAEDRAAAQERCFGAPALQHLDSCTSSGDPLTPSPAAAADDVPAAYGNGCHAPTTGGEANVCKLGDGPRRVALIGDSHAVSWEPAVEAAAKELGWTVSTYTKAACPLTTATTANGDAEVRASCAAWRKTMIAKLAAAQPYDLVLTTASATAARFDDDASAVAGYRAVWQPLINRGAKIIVLHDVPRAPADALECLTRTPQDPAACSLPRDRAFPSTDLMSEAATGFPGATVLDFTDSLCDDRWCYTAIGGVTVYRDEHHLTTTFARTLAPALIAKVRALG